MPHHGRCENGYKEEQDLLVQSDFRTLQIAPTITHQAQAIVDVLMMYNWTYIAIVVTPTPGYDDFISAVKTYGDERFKNHFKYGEKGYRSAVTDCRLNLNILDVVVLRNVSNKSHLTRDLLRLKEEDARVILLYCYDADSRPIVELATQLGMTGTEYIWILTMNSVPKNAEGSVGPASFPVGFLGVWYDFAKRAMVSTIIAGSLIWKSSLKALAYSNREIPDLPSLNCSDHNMVAWKNADIMYSYLKNVSAHGSPAIEFNEHGELRHPNIKIINLQPADNFTGTGKRWVEVGQWKRGGITMKKITWPGNAIRPPKGKPRRHFLRIATLKEEPYVIYRELSASGQCDIHSVPCTVYQRAENECPLSNQTIPKCCTGLSIDLLITLSHKLEFDFDLSEVEDGLWGAENGQWNGLIRVLTDRKADMVVTSLKINPARSAAVDFSVPYLETGITIIVAIREGAISATAFLEPYDYPSWCLILVVSVHVSGTCIFLFEWLSPSGLNRGRRSIEEHQFSLFRSFWMIWALLLGAAVSIDTPRGIASRFLGNVWALFALVFLASYTANLAAFMITKEEYYDLKGIHDIRLQNPQSMKPAFRFGTVPEGSTEANIKRNNVDMHRYMKSFTQPSPEEGIKRIKSQQLDAFIYDATVLEYQAGKDKDCKLITVGNWAARTGYGVAFPMESKWKNKIDGVILDLLRNGEMERLQRFWLSGACHNTKKKSTSRFGKGVRSGTLGIRNFTSAFIFLAIGILLGVILVALEHFCFHVGRRHLRHMDKCGCCSFVSLNISKTLSLRYTAESLMKHGQCGNKRCMSFNRKLRQDLENAAHTIADLRKEITKLKAAETHANQLDKEKKHGPRRTNVIHYASNVNGPIFRSGSDTNGEIKYIAPSTEVANICASSRYGISETDKCVLEQTRSLMNILYEKESVL
ncbi:glutamate receptor ionotropic, NMDA 2B-like [Gigantopelta aegis]|uniref:glutamate receptor ionotropic, NMDA 2B-like n=1 Tax=Gigantopelta aegis TaxID=1735272 RepID=UPI001B88C17D|nr:glutamate receptor ionotropic, NMDA 2B-like [Gigantopelta aegis]